MLRKANVLACLSKPEKSLTPQLDTVIIETSVKALSPRGNAWRLAIQGQTFANHEMGLMVIQDFTVPQLPILA